MDLEWYNYCLFEILSRGELTILVRAQHNIMSLFNLTMN